MTTVEQRKFQEAFQEHLDYDELLNCTRCGFCLPSCPTYVQSGKDEVQSPRGRIALMKGVVDGLSEVTDEVSQSMELCVGWRACEPACASGVNIGRLLGQASETMHQADRKPLHERLVINIAFDKLLPHPERRIST